MLTSAHSAGSLKDHVALTALDQSLSRQVRNMLRDPSRAVKRCRLPAEHGLHVFGADVERCGEQRKGCSFESADW